MSLPFDQAVCEVNQHRGSSHAVHQLDVLKGRLTVLPCIPVHATSATLRWCMRQDGQHWHENKNDSCDTSANAV